MWFKTFGLRIVYCGRNDFWVDAAQRSVTAHYLMALVAQWLSFCSEQHRDERHTMSCQVEWTKK